MKVGLIYPNSGADEKQIHLGLAYLASYVLNKHIDITVEVLDTGVSTKSEIDSFLLNEYDIIGLTVTSSTYREAQHMAKVIKDNSNGNHVLTVFGGPHVSIMMHEIMKDPLIDFAIYGEGELTFNELISYLKENYDNYHSVDELKKINGLIFRIEDKVVVNPPRGLIKNLDEIPYPAYQLFPMDRYKGGHSMITSRGCPFSCTFCATTQIWEEKWRKRSAENVVDEVIYLIRKYGAKPVDFHDACFNTDIKRVEKICDLFIEKKVKVPWTIRGFRADILNENIAKKMRKAGCAFVAIGIESANNEMLIRIGKKETKEEIADGIRILRSSGIDVLGQFMIGNPGETLEMVKESLKFSQESCLSSVVFGTAVPFPKTDLWDYIKKHGRFLIEPDCTRFGEIYPRVLFETPEFTEKERLEAIELARDAGVLAGEEYQNNIRKDVKNFVIGVIFKYFPGWISFQLYFLLRKLK